MQHKAKYITLFTLLAAAFMQKVNAQTPVLGFVQQENVKKAGVLTDAQLYPLVTHDKTVTRQYVDGFGRAIQTVAIGATPNNNDIIAPAAFDNLGMQPKAYLPYAGQSTDVQGSYRANALTTEQTAFYSNGLADKVADDNSPWATKLTDASPLQRVTATGMVGDNHQAGATGTQHYKTIIQRYNSAAADGNIIAWNPDNSYAVANYGDGQLSVSDVKDEDNVEIRVFKDIAGNTVLKRQLTATSGVYIDTYYIYNSAGMITYIIPPNALAMMKGVSNFTPSQSAISKLIYLFTYDTLGRLIEKTVPSKGITYIVYDPLNRPVLSQDAVMLAANKWNYVKYDVKGRVISQGVYTDATRLGRFNMQTYVNGLASAYNTIWYEKPTNTVTNSGYYTNAIFPTATTGTLVPLVYLYFDNYYMTHGGTADFAYRSQASDPNLPTENTSSLNTRSMPTIVCKAAVGNGLSNTWLTTATFYDGNGRPIQVQTNNHLYYSGYTTAAQLTDTKTVVNDFAGVPQASKVFKKTSASVTTTVYTYMTYDQMNRVTGISQKYNTAPSVNIAAYTYNELGQVVTKGLGQIAIPADLTLSGTYSGTSTQIATHSITFPAGTTVSSGSTFKAFISTGFLQSVDFRYNIRGQLLSINNSKLSSDWGPGSGYTNNDNTDLFGMQFMYDQGDANMGSATGLFNGKLWGVKWMSTDAAGTKSYERSYKYTYDALDRFTAASYAERATTATTAFNYNVGGFNEDGIDYDDNGNIQHLNRNSSTQGNSATMASIDQLTYTYDSSNPNQLLKISDGTGASYTGYGFRNLTGATTAASYSYYANGSLSTDPYKGIQIFYNDLNRTDKITVTAGTGQYIYYTYDGTGQLIRKQQYNGGTIVHTTDYVDGFTYLDATLSYFPMPEGRVINTGSTLKPEFVISDQQGNARISFQDNGSGVAVVTQENSYYAFGLVMPNSPVGTPGNDNKHLYNGGSEWQKDYGNLPDFYQTFYRNYDPALGRFVAVDPMAEGTESMTVYQYGNLNPILYNDPLGDLVGNTLKTSGLSNLLEGILASGGSGTWFNDGEGNFKGTTEDSGDITSDMYNDFGTPISATGNHAYQLQRDGSITVYGDYSGPHDKLISTNANGIFNVDNPSILVDPGILPGHTGSNAGVNYDWYQINDNDKAEAFYGFVANNSDVEWSRVQRGASENYIATSHDASSEIGGPDIIINRLAQANDIHLAMHSHINFPVEGYTGPSGFKTNDLKYHHLDSDWGVLQQINQLHPNNEIRFQIFYISKFFGPSGKVTSYDDGGVIDDATLVRTRAGY